jgi:hypothetical protein
MPPLKTRVKISNGDYPIDGYQMIPVFNYIDPNINDDIFYYGCKYINDADGYYYPRNDTYKDEFDFIFPTLKKPLQVAFDLTDEKINNMTFNDIYLYSDAQLSEDMEGVPRRYNYTAEEWYYLREA